MTEMTKGEKLIWELFLFVRELMPATADNTRRLAEWAAHFHEMEGGGSAAVAEDAEARDEAKPKRK